MICLHLCQQAGSLQLLHLNTLTKGYLVVRSRRGVLLACGLTAKYVVLKMQYAAYVITINGTSFYNGDSHDTDIGAQAPAACLQPCLGTWQPRCQKDCAFIACVGTRGHLLTAERSIPLRGDKRWRIALSYAGMRPQRPNVTASDNVRNPFLSRRSNLGPH